VRHPIIQKLSRAKQSPNKFDARAAYPATR
jgi:hypothetical protein